MYPKVTPISGVLLVSGLFVAAIAGWWLLHPHVFQSKPALSPSIAFTRDLPILDRSSLTQLEEIVAFSPTMAGGPIAALVFPEGQDEVVAAYSHENVVRRWSLDTLTLTDEVAVGIVSEHKSKLDVQGGRLATPSSVWDTVTGAQIWCDITCEYDGGETLFYAQGSWLVGYGDETSFFGVWCTGKQCNESYTYNLGYIDDPQGLLTIDRIAFSPMGDLAAVAFRQSIVRIYRVSNEAKFDLQYDVELGSRTASRLNPSQSLLFDNTQSWLALLRSGQLLVWDIRFGRSSLLFSIEVPTAQELAFDRTGNYLFVGTETALHILDVSSSKLLKKYPIANITALTTSPDGKALILGDAQGVVHVWGSADTSP